MQNVNSSVLDGEFERECRRLSGGQEYVCVSLRSADGRASHKRVLYRDRLLSNTAWTHKHAAFLWDTVHSRLYQVMCG